MTDKELYHQRLLEVFKLLHYLGKISTQTELAEKIGVRQAHFNSAMKGDPARVTANLMKKLAAAFPELSEEYLLTGEGEMLKADVSNVRDLGTVFHASAGDNAVSLVEFVPVASRASFIENLQSPDSDFETIGVILRPDERREIELYKIFEVEGDSMLPRIPNRSLVLARFIAPERWHYASGTVVIIYDEFIVIKRITENHLLTDSSITLTSDNPGYGSARVQLADIRAIYKVRRLISADID